MNLTQEVKERIKGGDIVLLKEVISSQYNKNVELLIASAKGSEHDNQLKGRCQILALLKDLLP